MKKTIALTFAAVIGGALGVLVFMLTDWLLRLPFEGNDLEAWPEHSFFILGSAGAVCGAVMGWVVGVSPNRPRLAVFAPSKTPAAAMAVQAPRNVRPLTWVYRNYRAAKGNS